MNEFKDLSKFDAIVNIGEVREAIKASNTKEVPEGNYEAEIVDMRLGTTNNGEKPLFSAILEITKGPYGGRRLRLNRTIANGNNPQTWNPTIAIKSVCDWINSILKADSAATREFLGFEGFVPFAKEIADISEEYSGQVVMDISYNPKKFNNIEILNVRDK